MLSLVHFTFFIEQLFIFIHDGDYLLSIWVNKLLHIIVFVLDCFSIKSIRLLFLDFFSVTLRSSSITFLIFFIFAWSLRRWAMEHMFCPIINRSVIPKHSFKVSNPCSTICCVTIIDLTFIMQVANTRTCSGWPWLLRVVGFSLMHLDSCRRDEFGRRRFVHRRVVTVGANQTVGRLLVSIDGLDEGWTIIYQAAILVM